MLSCGKFCVQCGMTEGSLTVTGVGRAYGTGVHRRDTVRECLGKEPKAGIG